MDEYCYICFEECNENRSCACKSFVHKECLAKWQLRKAGTREEHNCRLCNTKLDDWRYILRPDYDELAKLEVYIFCRLGRKKVYIPITHDTTKETFREILKLELGVSDRFLNKMTFDCLLPESKNTIKLTGIDAFDAIVFCARISQENHTKKELQRNTKTKNSICHNIKTFLQQFFILSL
jgi:hypothetical protein